MPKARSKSRAIAFNVLRWGVAIIGIFIVVRSLHLADRVLLLDAATNRPVEADVVGPELKPGQEDAWPVRVWLPDNTAREVTRDEVLIRPDRAKVTRKSDGKPLYLLALDLPPGTTEPRRLLVAETKSSPGVFLTPSELAEPYVTEVAFPAREVGLTRMVRSADTTYLLLALAVIPAIYLLTGYRWWLLLRSLGVPIPVGQALQINLVGTFYNTFLPGSTGGDVLKAYYAAKVASNVRTRAVLSVVVDRAIGLLALIIMGGICAGLQWNIPQCRQVALVAMAICVSLAIGLVVFGYRPLRNALGVGWLLSKLPLQEKLEKMTDALRALRQRPGLVLLVLAMSCPVHATVVVSAMFAGWAFGLPLDWTYYWVVVPTVVLSGAIPISPQGAGVMEFFAVLLTRPQGATVGQAVALTMSIRLVQIFWNLAAGVIVLKGGYHAPTEQEQAELEGDGAVRERAEARA